MSKKTRWLLACAGVVVVLGGALVWQNFHQQIISTLGGGVASIAPIRGGQNTAASSAPAPAMPGPPAESPVTSPNTTSAPQTVRLHSTTGRVVSCSKDVLVIARGEEGRLSIKITEDNKAECVRNMGRVVRVEYTQTGARKIASRASSVTTFGRIANWEFRRLRGQSSVDCLMGILKLLLYQTNRTGKID